MITPILSPEVSAAIETKKPIVALESTILAHGMPFPRNLEMATEVDEIIRGERAVPATAAVIDGQLKLGLSEQETRRLAQESGVLKLSRRDIPFAISQNRTGATTVAATMIIAEMAGVEVFVTGGIGGVHRGADQSWDISADLTELEKTNVTVVCAGAKSILDIPKTLEYLETLGVPVVGFGVDIFPAFYYRNSGLPVQQRLDTASEIASLIIAKREMQLQGGVLIANPVPKSQEADKEEIESAIARSIVQAQEKAISGKELTPFLLSSIKEMTAGRSLEANIALVKNNARLGAEIACELVRLKP